MVVGNNFLNECMNVGGGLLRRCGSGGLRSESYKGGVITDMRWAALVSMSQCVVGTTIAIPPLVVPYPVRVIDRSL